MTHPELKVIDAIYMSSSIPIVFQPFFYDGSYYIDSGFLNSYPVNICLDDNHNIDEIFGITYEPGDNKMVITEDDSVFSFVNCIFRNMIDNNDVSKKYIGKLKYEIIVRLDNINSHDAVNMMNHKQKREESVSEGKIYAKEFLKRIQFVKK
jgi:predicted acylesterase/phospholipase RssA